MMLLRANSLAKGFSGVRPVVIDTLCEMLNRGVHPVIPSQGSVGASGDLAPLGASRTGVDRRRRSNVQGKRVSAADAMKQARYQAAGAAGKGSDLADQWHASHARRGTCWSALQAEILADTADVVGALTLDALKGTDVAFDERIHRARPHPGQLLVAKTCAACWKAA